ncbi:MAG: RNA polymerase sigma factor, partial [Actinomycetota bacterium]|nr:RNA polymerase sigma factor [Actinomycetota bacterium]
TKRAQEVSLDADDGLTSADRRRLTVVTTPDTALDSKQALNDLRGAFGSLSENHHEILVLRELEGRSYTDIGQRLGLSRPAVESTLFRARRRLAEEYDELASGRRCEFVREMVDSAPHYSLGIRDRRRIARHLAHCQPCRAHARTAGFDESILNVPSIAARIAAFLPIPILRGRWSPFGSIGHHRGRPSLLALRSVHTLAGSSDQLLGVGTGAGRGAATAAALVLAGVGGGLVTEGSYEHSKPAHSSALIASADRPPALAVALPAQGQLRMVSSPFMQPARIAVTSGRAHPAHSRSRRARGASSRDGSGASKTAAPKASAPSAPAPAGAVAPPTTGVRASTPATGSGSDGPTATGASGASGPTSTGLGSLPAVPSPPSLAPVSAAIPSASTVITTLDGVTAAVPQVPPIAGTGAGASETGPIAGTIGSVTARLGQLGHYS